MNDPIKSWMVTIEHPSMLVKKMVLVDQEHLGEFIETIMRFQDFSRDDKITIVPTDMYKYTGRDV